jgi:hypothetical protein
MVEKALAVEADALQGRLDGMGQNKARAFCIAANGYQCFEPAPEIQKALILIAMLSRFWLS